MMGLNPNDGTKLRNVTLRPREYADGRVLHPNLAWDFTFSAPKSVSVLWATADKETRLALERCQERAVKEAITYLESHASVTRTGKGGVNREKLDLIFASFRHTTSRNLDPQLHEHVLLLNTGIRENGKGGAVDARGIFTHLHTLGVIYRNTLRLELEREINVTTLDKKLKKESSFEIVGVPKELSYEQSSRSNEIVIASREKERALGRSLSARELNNVVLETRRVKEIVSREELFSNWEKKAKAHGFDWKKVIRETPIREVSKEERERYTRSVSSSLSYKEKIAEKQILHTALYQSRGRFSQKEVLEFVKDYKENYLVPINGNDKETSYTLTSKGLELASSTGRTRYDKFRFTLNRVVSRYESWCYRHRVKAYERKIRALKYKITKGYLLGRISHKTYSRVIHGKGLPTTKAGIQLAYATHQISARHRDFLLQRLDPKEEKKREEKRERREKAHWERAANRTAKELKIRELESKGLINERTAHDLRSGTLRLDLLERDIIRKGQLNNKTQEEKKEDTEKVKPSDDWGNRYKKSEELEKPDVPRNNSSHILKPQEKSSTRELSDIERSRDDALWRYRYTRYRERERAYLAKGRLDLAQDKVVQANTSFSVANDARTKRIEMLYNKNIISPVTYRAIQDKTIALEVIEHNLERRGTIEKMPSPKAFRRESTDRRTEKPKERDYERDR